MDKKGVLVVPRARCSTYLCGHCGYQLQKKAYERHKSLYYDSTTKQWIKKRECDALHVVSAGSNDSELSDDDFEDEDDIMTEDDAMTEDVSESPSPLLSLEEPSRTTVDRDVDDVIAEDHSFEGTEDCFTPSASDVDYETEEIWEGNQGPGLDEDIDLFCSDPTDYPADILANPFAMWLIFFLVRLQAKHYIPDAALAALLKFLYTFFLVLGRFSEVASGIAIVFPRTLRKMRKAIGYSDNFDRFVVCPACDKTFKFKECISVTGTRQTTKHCCFVKYPQHPRRSGRAACDAPLLRSVRLQIGRTLLYPFKVYCYRSLITSIQELLLRPGFFDACQLWQNQVTSELSDVYSGKIWKDFQHFNSEPFLLLPSSIALMLNIDWFQPYTHTVFSVGVIYLVVMNLQRSTRFKRQNIIIVSIIPGPSEPGHDINSYMEPLIKDLTDLWKGVSMSVKTGGDILTKTIRCAVLCCACDLPAGRKVCGFLGHSASLGCSKCLKRFSGSVGNMSYAGFDRSSWVPRTDDQHRKDIQEVTKAKSKSEQAKKDSEFGCRYSILLELPYFDPPRMLVIDPMHNLFLGSAKHLLFIWLEQDILSKNQFKLIQDYVDNTQLPSDVGRIPTKIETGFTGFTADQFKNWVIVYSVPSLYGLLPPQHLECWRHFVLACRLLCKQSLKDHDVHLVDALLLQFCKKVQELYGERSVTPNMHLHGHLKEVLLDFGPVFEFWLFSFERYNGILGNQPHSNRLIESQLLSRFLRDNFSFGSHLPEEFSDDFISISLVHYNIINIIYCVISLVLL